MHWLGLGFLEVESETGFLLKGCIEEVISRRKDTSRMGQEMKSCKECDLILFHRRDLGYKWDQRISSPPKQNGPLHFF